MAIVRGVGDSSQQNNLNSLISIEINNRANAARTSGTATPSTTGGKPGTPATPGTTGGTKPAPDPNLSAELVRTDKTLDAAGNIIKLVTGNEYEQAVAAFLRDPTNANLTIDQKRTFAQASQVVDPRPIKDGTTNAGAQRTAGKVAAIAKSYPGLFDEDELYVATKLIEDIGPIMGGLNF